MSDLSGEEEEAMDMMDKIDDNPTSDNISPPTTSEAEQCTSRNVNMDIGSSNDAEHSADCDTQRQIEELESDVRTVSLKEKEIKCSCPAKSEAKDSSNKGTLLNGQELLDFIRSLHTGSQVTEGVTTIGLVS